MSFSIATWNLNSINVRLQHVLDWLSSNPVDVLAVQETKMTDDKFPADAIREAGYQVCFSGQKTYNGVAVLSKTPVTDIVTDIPDLDDPARRILACTLENGTRLINLYVPNGASPDSDKYPYKLNWLEKVTAYIKEQSSAHDKITIVGDFNIAPNDEDVHDPAAWEGQVLVSPPERAALQNILELGYTDVFRLFDQDASSFSWWDYRGGSFRRNHGMRIDLILANAALTKNTERCEIDKTPRQWERPSDHTPVIATFKD